MEETGVPGDNHQPVASHAWVGFELTMLVMIDTDCIGSCKYNYHTVTITTASKYFLKEIKRQEDFMFLLTMTSNIATK